MHSLLMVGWRETVALPSLGISELVAKVDTGARSSSLHAVAFEISDDGATATFWVPTDGPKPRLVTAQAPMRGWRWVKDSGGHSTLRPVVAVELELAGRRFVEEVTLADRGGMRHRMLLGRRTVRGHFVVDPSREFLLSNMVDLPVAASAA
jgi:hypothetical protein